MVVIKKELRQRGLKIKADGLIVEALHNSELATNDGCLLVSALFY